MFRHPRFVRRGGGKRWICLTKEERGGSVICYKSANEKEGKAVKNSIISSLKIGASTEMQNLKDKGIPNAFVLKSGKRQWVLQAASTREYNLWSSGLVAMLKEFGPVNLNGAAGAEASPKGSPQSVAKSPKGSPKQSASAGSNPNAGRLMRE